jgi:hydroxyacylglutathione hydrolase
MRSVSIFPIPAFSDNYLWLLHDDHNAYVVDPGDAAAVKAALHARGLTLKGIVVTHHHSDHVGGVIELAAQYRCPVWGPSAERIEGLTHQLIEGDVITLDAIELLLRVIEVPGHTSGHIAYYADSAPGRNAPLLLCGDTLFSAGCGRLFEGTPEQMMHSLAKLSALPGNTEVYCTHEYTVSNLAFSKVADPHNISRDEYLDWCIQQRQHGQPTLPSNIARECSINPFLRCDVPEVRSALAQQAQRPIYSSLEAFALMREWKNNFRT